MTWRQSFTLGLITLRPQLGKLSSLQLTSAFKSHKLMPDKLARRQESQALIIWYCKVNYTLHRPPEEGKVSKGPKGCIQDVCSFMRLFNHTEEECLNLSSTRGDNESLKSLSVVRWNNKRKEKRKEKKHPNTICDVISPLCNDHSNPKWQIDRPQI